MTLKISILSGHGDIGGGEQMLLRIAEAAQSLGHAVTIVGPTWGDLAAATEGIRVEFIGLPGSDRRSYGLSLARFASGRHRSLMWANGALPALAASATPNDLLVHLHQRPSRVQSAALKLSSSRAKIVVVPSRSMQRGIPGSQVLLNWTQDIRPIKPREQNGEFVIGYVGRTSLDKGVDVLVDAASQVAKAMPAKRVRLVIAGDGRFVPREALAEVQRSLSRCEALVSQTGWVDPLEIYRQVDVCVVPSRWAEPFGLVAAEAMAAACPLVVSDAGALPEVVGPDYPLVSRHGDASDTAEKILVVASHPRSHWTPASRERWQHLFSPSAGRARLAALLESLG